MFRQILSSKRAHCFSDGAAGDCTRHQRARPPRLPKPGNLRPPRTQQRALIEAAEKFDETALVEILGPDSYDIIHTGEPARDREVAKEFASLAGVKTHISVQPKNSRLAYLAIGDDDWPFPVPMVKTGSGWWFDTKAGRQEILYRRIGSNELNAIEICRGYVEAQHEYALTKRGTSGVNQYAQRIISTPGTQDGLAWRNSDGTWGGPIGEKVAAAIARGYTTGLSLSTVTSSRC